jgi:hypothetical protein
MKTNIYKIPKYPYRNGLLKNQDNLNILSIMRNYAEQSPK